MELGMFALELVMFALEFVMAIMTQKTNYVLVMKWMIFAMEDATWDRRRCLKLVYLLPGKLINLFESDH